MRNAFAAIAFATAALVATPASADDFVLNVPVRIENAELISSARLSCRILFAPATGEQSVTASARVPIVDGDYTGTMSVTIAAPTGLRRQDAHSWFCDLEMQLRTPAGTFAMISLNDAGQAARYAEVSGRVVDSVNTSEAHGFTR